MKLSRWIIFPLVFAILWALQAFLFWEDLSVFSVVSRFVAGALLGFGLQTWSDSRARKKSGIDDSEEIYKVRQKRSVTVAGSRSKVLELCREALGELGSRGIRVNKESGEIRARTKITWESFGTTIAIKVVEISENLVEAIITTRPIPRTAAVDYGNGWEAVEKISSYLRQHDMKVQNEILSAGAEILLAAPRRPIDPIPEVSKKVRERLPNGKIRFSQDDL